MKGFYLFDSDMTLLDTTSVKPHMITNEGKSYVVDNPGKCGVHIIDDSLRDTVNSMYSRHENVAIVTNSPERCARALLVHHGFNTGIPVFGALSKPKPGSLEGVIRSLGWDSSNAVIIGDSPGDILAGHECGVAGVGVTWGDFPEKKLLKAEPADMIHDPVQLEDVIDCFENDELEYSPRSAPGEHIFLEKERWGVAEDVVVIKLWDYYKKEHPNFRDSNSRTVLNYKRIKEFSVNDTKQGVCDRFFYSGEVRNGAVLYKLMRVVKNGLLHKIDQMNLQGSTYVFAAPNSFPEYCYRCDANQWMANQINRHLQNDSKTQRKMFRVYPKAEAHNNGSRDLPTHYRTMGMLAKRSVPKPDNAILLDDVTSSGSQIKAMAKMMRGFLRYEGNIYGLVVGKNVGW
ncbi:HAD family hydrolase [Nanoarchaeota archaeon]